MPPSIAIATPVLGGPGTLRIVLNSNSSPPSGATAAWQCFVWSWLVGTLCVDSTDPFHNLVPRVPPRLRDVGLVNQKCRVARACDHLVSLTRRP
jgi:hypothetical protein